MKTEALFARIAALPPQKFIDMKTTSLRFSMTREKTGNRTGPRYYRVPDLAGLDGAVACAARMIHCAIRKRRAWKRSLETLRNAERWNRATDFIRLCVELDAHSMREAALWARRFAKQVPDNDPRWAVLDAQGKALRDRLHAHCMNHDALAA